MTYEFKVSAPVPKPVKKTKKETKVIKAGSSKDNEENALVIDETPSDEGNLKEVFLAKRY